MVKIADNFVFENVTSARLQKATLMLRAIAHPLRLKILGCIDRNKEIQVNKIYSTLSIEQSITSQHLKILRQSGYVLTRRKGKYIFYSLNYSLLLESLTFIEKYKLK